ncbi:regulator of G-protein signaling 5-like [Protopterus annectens]|uniref:regulator of G-protein signaling 5-like n=1 Tax=Protopterus annectens TaxID=7888 RepID=UPI001CFABAA1|nr:regulator of G-protein signaling 5-like [Protopterus annectens]
MCRGLTIAPTNCLERAKELKTRLNILLQKSDVITDLKNSTKAEKVEKPRSPCEDTTQWTEPLESVLSCKKGFAAFQNFLRLEFSEENIEFWLACENFRKSKSSGKLEKKAWMIYEEFIKNDAAKEVNLDHETKEITRKNLQQVTHTCFDLAQKKIYNLMESDSYSRFLKSALFQELLAKHCGGNDTSGRGSCQKSQT